MKNIGISFCIALAYLRERKFSAALNVLLLALGVATIIALVLILTQAESRMQRDSAGIDLVIGAKGSPMQLVLSSVFQVDIPTGNISVEEASQVIAEPAVKLAVPLALGESYRGFRIVGTNPAYIGLYGGQLAGGRLWDKPLEAVLGADAAKTTGLKIGSTFNGSHGLSDSGGASHDQAYSVVGVLAPTGSVLDRLIVTSVASVWVLHDHEQEPAAAGASAANPAKDDHAGHDHSKGNEVTAYLVQYATPLAAISFPRFVNATSSMQAASPAMESARLFQLLGVGIAALKGFAAIMMLCAALGIFIGLMNALDERRADLALLRVLGASPMVVVLVTLAQGLMVGLMGVILGLLLGHAGAEWIGQTYAESQRVAIGGRIWVVEEVWIVLAALGLALIASIVPAWRAYRDATPELLASR